MTIIRLRFPASRYHATPWGRHVNEGVAEWPPSPYRLLRGLYDVWRRKCADLPESAVETLLSALATSEPRFVLPPAIASHTRSYLSSNSEDPTDKNLVFDAFLAFDRGAVCYISWPELQLSEDQRAALEVLLRNLNYLGRSESWVDAALETDAARGEYRCDPVQAAKYSGEVMPVACVVPPAEYGAKRPWFDALTYSTAEMVKERRSVPPLLKSVRYVLPADSVRSRATPKLVRRDPEVRAVLLGLDATVLPLVTETVAVAEQIRVRLMGAHRIRCGGDARRVSPLFSGKDESGGKRLDHGHLYVLPLGDSAGRIDRVLLLSRRAKFRFDELDAVRGVRELYQSDDRGKVRCVVTWQGGIEPGAIDDLKPATAVASVTPFITVRHTRRGRDLERFLEDEVRRECLNQGLAQPVKVERLARISGLFDVVEYRRNRKDDPVRPGYAFRLFFERPVLSPFALGYGSHYGLGQFRPTA
jgi:CRISPR-associated protein Csb2